MSDDWKLIKTAPKDRYILIYDGLKMDVVMWDDSSLFGHGVSGWVTLARSFVGCDVPTHWMPLPQPPKESNKEEKS